ncbi:MAG: anhydro-N-acetylmuramic acid kinase [Burkholderiaceae bacterium]
MAPLSLFVGLMSGTSTDGVDAVLADFSDLNHPEIKAHAALPMPETLRREFLNLNTAGENELMRAALAGNALAKLYAQAVHGLLDETGLKASDILAIGAHGQTVRHDPAAGYTIQINNPALLAELTGIDVIADFRSRDVAAQGQGAPLVPAFHKALFSSDHPRVVLNLGGIANVTLLNPRKEVQGFDTGPANVLLDLWCGKKTGRPYDEQGKWASAGHTNTTLLNTMIHDEPWFSKPPPKSTGRDLFNESWLELHLKPQQVDGMSDSDIQATLQSLTAQTIAQAIHTYAPETQDVLICGGGALNSGLVKELTHRLQLPVYPTSQFGVPTQLVEALAFAWLAWAYLNDYPAGLPTVTGARHATILGCRYPA